jgi:hypothetical protein
MEGHKGFRFSPGLLKLQSMLPPIVEDDLNREAEEDNHNQSQSSGDNHAWDFRCALALWSAWRP